MNVTAATGLLSPEAAAATSDIVKSQELEPFLLNETQPSSLLLSANNNSSSTSMLPSNLVMNANLNMPAALNSNQETAHTGSSYFATATNNPCFSADGNRKINT